MQCRQAFAHQCNTSPKRVAWAEAGTVFLWCFSELSVPWLGDLAEGAEKLCVVIFVKILNMHQSRVCGHSSCVTAAHLLTIQGTLRKNRFVFGK